MAELRPYQRDGLDFLAFVTDARHGRDPRRRHGSREDRAGAGVDPVAARARSRGRSRAGRVPGVGGPQLAARSRRASRRASRCWRSRSGKERHALREEMPSHDARDHELRAAASRPRGWRSIPLRAAILDEAQNVKNPDAAVSRAVLQLERAAAPGADRHAAREPRARPVEHHAVRESRLPRQPRRASSRGTTVPTRRRTRAALLAARLRPVMMRRLKEQVAPELPERIEERARVRADARPAPALPRRAAEEPRAPSRGSRPSPDGVRREQDRDPGGAHAPAAGVLPSRARRRARGSSAPGKFDALFELLELAARRGAQGARVLAVRRVPEAARGRR